MPEYEARPIYRHLVVQRKDLVEHVDVEQLRRLRYQQDTDAAVDADLQHLVIKDTLKKTVRKVMRWAGHGDVEVEAVEGGVSAGAASAEAQKMKERGDEGTIQYQPQEGVIVSRIVQGHIPGDAPGQAMPLNPTYLSHPGFDSAEDYRASFMRCVQELHAKFQAFSDRKFVLLGEGARTSTTLVTVVLTPIIAIPRADVGIELMCEFYQKSQFGYIDSTSFDVFSEIGEFPIQFPSDEDLRSMLQGADQFNAVVAY